MAEEMREHLESVILPFWRSVKDGAGYFESVDFDLVNNEDTEKTAIFQCECLRFFSECAAVLGGEEILEDARCAYKLVSEKLVGEQIYYSSVDRMGEGAGVANARERAVMAGALAAYARAEGDRTYADKGVEIAMSIETFPDDISSLADVCDGLALLFDVSAEEDVRRKLGTALESLVAKCADLSVCDASRCGWLPDACAVALTDCDASKSYDALYKKCVALCEKSAQKVISSLKEGGLEEGGRVLWKAQANGVLSMANAYLSSLDEKYLNAAYDMWAYIRDCFEDRRHGGEWFRTVLSDGTRPCEDIVDREKSPLHQGLMCVKVIEWQTACEVLERYDGDEGLGFTIDPDNHCGHHHCD